MRLLVIGALFWVFYFTSACTPVYYYDINKKSARFTECKAGELVILDDEGPVMGGHHKWKVECAGKRYQCEETPGASTKCYPVPE